jgi:hypothetical protein
LLNLPVVWQIFFFKVFRVLAAYQTQGRLTTPDAVPALTKRHFLTIAGRFGLKALRRAPG